MSESSSKPKPVIGGAALKRGPHGQQQKDQGGKAAAQRKISRAPVTGAAHLHVSETASSISTSTNARQVNYQAPVKLENTYRMEPHNNKKFKCKQVDDAVKSILESYLCDVDYNKDKCPTLTRDLSQMIKQRVREMDFERYKVVVTVVLGENTNQGCELASRSLWNTNTDNFVSIPYRNKTLFAVASVYGVYYE